MPFCRECGKEVQDDWVTCPYCSSSIGAPAVQNISLQDSAMSGDINFQQTHNVTNINDIKCTSCSSIGSVQTACLICKKIAYCDICKTRTINQMQEWWKDYQKYVSEYETRHFNDILEEGIKFCKECYSEKKEKLVHEFETTRKKCPNCDLLREPGKINTCFKCKKTHCGECRAWAWEGMLKEAGVAHRGKYCCKSHIGLSEPIFGFGGDKWILK